MELIQAVHVIISVPQQRHHLFRIEQGQRFAVRRGISEWGVHKLDREQKWRDKPKNAG